MRVDTSIQRLIDDLTDTMFDAPGAGLAANQIGVALRVCVVKGDDTQIWGVVNPEIVKTEGDLIPAYEGCLSLPGWIGEVARPEIVTVKGLNRHGKQVRIKATGFTARAFQHEIDHLDGMLFTQKLTDIRTLMRLDEFEAERKQTAVAVAAS